MLTQLEHALTHQVSDRAVGIVDASGQIVEGEILQFWVLVNQRTDGVVRDALSAVFEWRRGKLRPREGPQSFQFDEESWKCLNPRIR